MSVNCGRRAGAAGNVAPARRCGCRAPSALSIAILIVLVTVGSDVGAQYWTPFRDAMHPAILVGNWQSCRDEDGYAERIADLRPPGLPAVELHLGPYHDFALFRGIRDEHRDHDSSANLLHPHVVGQAQEQMARQRWTTLGYHIDVVLAGGSREDCESFFVTVTRAESRGTKE